jgi:adenylate cyclase
MNIEIERKFLVKDPTFLISVPHYCYIIHQYYIDEGTRIRIKDYGEDHKEAFVTMKSKREEEGRYEQEFKVDVKAAQYYYEQLNNKKRGLGAIKKTRHVLHNVDSSKECCKWEIDVFHEENEGLILAEIELLWGSARFDKLKGLGKEVTDDERYYNAYLAKCPYKEWKENE